MTQPQVSEASASAARKAILVLGMHRSGTSATTRVINLLGAYLGEHLMGPGYSNEQGFWEHLDLFRINDQLMRSLGMTWNDPRRMPSGWQETSHYADALRKITIVLEEEFDKTPLWAVKDPRICRLVPLWRQALNNKKVRTHALIVVRHPDEIADSLAVRDGLSRSQVHLLWARHLCEAERATRDLPRYIVAYNQLLTDWRSEMQRASAALDLVWPIDLDAAAEEIDKFLNIDNRHHARAEKMQGQTPEPWIDMVFREFCAVASSGDWSRVRAISDQFDSVTGMTDAYLSEVHWELDTLRTKHSAFENTASLMDAAQRSLNTSIADAEVRLRQEIHGNRTTHMDATQALEALWKNESARAAERDGKAITKLEALSAQIVQTDTGVLKQLELLLTQMSERNDELDALHAQVKHLQYRLGHSEAELARQQRFFVATSEQQRQRHEATIQDDVAKAQELRLRADEIINFKQMVSDLTENLNAANRQVERLQEQLDYTALPWYKKIQLKHARS